MQSKKDAAHVTRTDSMVGTYEKVEKEKVAVAEEEEVGFMVDTSHGTEAEATASKIAAAADVTTTDVTTTTTSDAVTATTTPVVATKPTTKGKAASTVMATIAPDYGHGPMTMTAESPLDLPSTVTSDVWEAYDPSTATTTLNTLKKSSAAGVDTFSSPVITVVGDSKDIRPFTDFTAIVPLNTADIATTIPASTSTTAATATMVSVPVATTTEDVSTIVGQPPNHKDGEPMYPTVVDMPLSEPDNANAPTAEKLGNEDALGSAITTAADKATKNKEEVAPAASDSASASTITSTTATSSSSSDKAKKGTTFADHHLTTSLPQGMTDIMTSSSDHHVARPTMTPRTVKPAEYHGGDRTHKPTHIEHVHDTRKPTHVEIGKATRKPTHLEGGDALKVVQKVKGVTVAQASEASFQAAFIATVAKVQCSFPDHLTHTLRQTDRYLIPHSHANICHIRFHHYLRNCMFPKAV